MIRPIHHKDSFQNKKVAKKLPPSWRLFLLFLFFLVAVALLIGRLFQLHITHTDFLKAQGKARTLRIVDIPSYRGMITDRRGTPLAISTPLHAIWVNPQHFHATEAEYLALAKRLDISPLQLKQKMLAHPERGFIYLKRGLTPAQAAQVKALNISGIYVKREFHRFYPQGRETGQLVGFTDVDDHGQAGLELAFESILKPTIGKKRVLEDRTGRWVQDIDLIQAASSGKDIALSIDLRIQGFAFRELEKAIQQFQAKSATLVMLDIKTGEVLAMVSAPSFNPNNRQSCHGNATRNRALTDLLEPGSTIKPFAIASALSTRTITANTPIDTTPGVYKVQQHIVKDVRNYGVLTVKEVLSKSSNVGISKITLAHPSELLIETFRALGLGETTLTPFPGERSGILPPPPKNAFVHATLAFGYGLSVTPMQLAHAYAVLAAGGIRRPISLIKLDHPSDVRTERVFSTEVAHDVLEMLMDVMNTGGTGRRAQIPGYHTAGKTGTTRIVGPHGYDRHRHIALFAGITPVHAPRLATIVIVEEPNEAHYYGGLVAAPIYKNVVSKSLYILNIPPDNTLVSVPPTGTPL